MVLGVGLVGSVRSVGFGVVGPAEAAPALVVAAAVEVEAAAAATSYRPTAAATVAFAPSYRPVGVSTLLCLHCTVFVDREVPAGSLHDLLPVVPVSPTSVPGTGRDRHSS